MDTLALYEKRLIDECLESIKDCRDRWRANQWDSDVQDNYSDLCSLYGRDGVLYLSVLQRAQENLRKALTLIAFDLAVNLKRNVSLRGDLRKRLEEIYLIDCVGNKREVFRSSPEERCIPLLCFGGTNEKTLFLFRENNLRDFLPNEVHKCLLADSAINRITYVTFCQKGAGQAVRNWERCEGGRIRGYKTYSYEEFIEDEFGSEEWNKLSAVLERCKKAAREYCGLSVVKAVSPNSLRFFKNDVEEGIKTCMSRLPLNEKQRAILNRRFIEGEACRILVGTSDFSKSFIAAEWQYRSLINACRSMAADGFSILDFSPVVSSYFKSVEQYLYAFISLHTKERDELSRTMFINKKHSMLLPTKDFQGRVEPIRLEDGNVEVSDLLMSPAFEGRLTLAPLVSFFGSIKNGRTYKNIGNFDLFVDDAIDSGIYDELIKTLNQLPDD